MEGGKRYRQKDVISQIEGQHSTFSMCNLEIRADKKSNYMSADIFIDPGSVGIGASFISPNLIRKFKWEKLVVENEVKKFRAVNNSYFGCIGSLLISFRIGGRDHPQ